MSDFLTKPPEEATREELIAELARVNRERDRLLGRITFQENVAAWMNACFGREIAEDRIERNFRFLEEALELVQACGCGRSDAHQLVDYVYDRPWGKIGQEIGGVLVTLAALANAHGQDVTRCGDEELARIWTRIQTIRAKQAAKPKHSPLPQQEPARHDMNVFEADEDEPGVHFRDFQNALQIWSLLRGEPTSVRDAMAAFNVRCNVVLKAVEEHPWMYVLGAESEPEKHIIEHDGE